MYFIHTEREIGEPISIGEWQTYLEEDLEMEFSNTTNYTSPFGEEIQKSGGQFGIWHVEDKEVPFYFSKGIISVIYDSKTLKKLKDISNYFEGYIYGDTGEEY